LGFGLALALGFAGSGHATTLADLNGGASLMVGSLTFSDFTVTVTGSLDANLADYQVLTLPDGFKIVGNFSASGGQQGDMLVSYDVTTAGPKVDDIGLKFDGMASGPHSAATVSETLFQGGNSIGQASVLATGSGLSKLADTLTFAPVTSFQVEKDILLTGGTGTPPPSSEDADKDKKHDADKDKKNNDKDDRQNAQGDENAQGDQNGDEDGHHHHKHLKVGDLEGGGLSTISFVSQEFSVVPEPGTLVLLSGGLAGLLAFGRRRER
jgi:hypothetical protein